MKQFLWFLLGALSICVIAVVASTVVLMRSRGLSAREQPMGIENWAAHWARAAALPSGASARTNPIPKTPEVLSEARAHWADHCALCHANDGGGDPLMGKR